MTQMNSEQAKKVFEGLAEIERFAATLADSKIALGADTLRAGLDDIRIHAKRMREENGGTVQLGEVAGAKG